MTTIKKKICYYPVSDDFQRGVDIGKSRFLPHSSLCPDPATNPQYLLDDTLYFRVSVKVDKHKPWLVCTDKLKVLAKDYSSSEASSCVRIIRATGYEAMKDSNGWYFDQPFYIYPGGYKMSVAIACNGEQSCKGTHVSVFVRLLEGSCDASLSWPFLGTVTFTLLNQLSNRDHHTTMTLEYNKNSKFGYAHKIYRYINFISQSALSHDPEKNTQYLENDTQCFRVSVQVKDYKPWIVCTL